jgi:1,4-alpha-glucan branching enzyme
MTKAQKREAKALARQGYRRVSNSGRRISRIDRPDWQEYMAEQGLEFAKLEDTDGSQADYYRRVYSQDRLQVKELAVYSLIPPSGFDRVGYIPKG